MPYKESLAYSKDLIKGTKIEVLKKKLIMPFAGTATVKLYDSLTGKQTYEAESENRISAVFGNIAYLDGFYYPMLDNDQDDLLTRIYTTYPFRIMVLTTGDIPEDPYDYFTWGNIIGYADSIYKYSSSDSLKGNVNNVETTRNENTKHYVMDFPTNAANGTFKSIYWTGGAGVGSSAQSPKINSLYTKRTLEAGSSGNYLPDYNLCTDETNLYALKINSVTLYAYDKITGDKKSDITLPAAAKAIAYDGTNFWILISDDSFKKLDKNFTLAESYLKSAAIPGELVSGVHYYDMAVNAANVYITYNGCTDSSGSSSKYKSCVAKYNKDGTFSSKAEIYTGSSGNIILTKIPNNKFWVMINYGTCLQLNSDMSIYGTSNFTSTDYDSIAWDEDTSTLFTAGDSNYGELKQQYIVPASAHTLLPEAITKTPTNTMKIQYDFTCDYVYPLDMSQH
ncbi:hypothetical protein [Clostridium tyrobutyricum]|uniref:hypothetical protein n=1 Tax=Clostridium tyrobutyricum TaxID=1519 RepID=UPI0010AB1333|nr:hypothetical protein [Clostridium tyrobutyricum]QCH27784.1 hypothetical protein EZN00_01382 [Clostridium tyrobutyricum]